MKPKTIIYSLALTILALMASCSNDDVLAEVNPRLIIDYPSKVKNLKVVSEKILFINLTSGEKTNLTQSDNIHLVEGLYDCVYSADVTFENGEGSGAVISKGTLIGKAENISITKNGEKLKIETFLSAANEDFIIEEVFFSGTLRASGSQYYGDGYIKIFNNTDHVLYADGLAFCESKFKSVQYYEYSPDIRKDTFTVWSIYVIPGRGTDHPVMPGQSLLICDTGIDHRVANPNSFDLSKADFEWYDVSTSPSHLDIDSPTVPNLDKWYCYTLSFYVLHNRGFTSFALARIPKNINKEQYLKDFLYTYYYTMYLPQGTFPMKQTGYKIPNTWIVDGVNCSVQSSRLWNILPPSVDAGWTHVGYTDHDKARYFRSIRRKLQFIDRNGVIHLQDTNNSTDDFNTECIPSLREEQGTAISSDGTKASTLTYDGVIPKK